MRRQKKSHPEIISAALPDYSQRAAAVIRGGGIVAFPTETYYGLGVNPRDTSAVKRLFVLKKRPLSKPILVIICSLSQLSLLTSAFPEPYRRLAERYWPGPLTLIFPAKTCLSKQLTGGSGTIGVRLTSNKTAAGICKSAGMPISATSANISGHPPASSAAEVADYFTGQVDLIIDGGSATSSYGSTIVTLDDKGRLKIVREGMTRINIAR